MSHGHAAVAHAEGAHHNIHPDSYYWNIEVKIWLMLLALLVVSIIGPMYGHPVITLVTAFGIAFVKAFMVCAYFMHLSTEKSYISYLLIVALLAVALMFAGVSPDVMKGEGTNWKITTEVRIPPQPHHAGGADHGTGAGHQQQAAEEAAATHEGVVHH